MGAQAQALFLREVREEGLSAILVGQTDSLRGIYVELHRLEVQWPLPFALYTVLGVVVFWRSQRCRKKKKNQEEDIAVVPPPAFHHQISHLVKTLESTVCYRANLIYIVTGHTPMDDIRESTNRIWATLDLSLREEACTYF